MTAGPRRVLGGEVGVATSVLGGVLKGGEERCLLSCRNPRRTIRQSVRAKFRQLLSLSGTEAAQEAGVEQRLFGGRKRQAAGRQHEQSIQLHDRPELPGQAASRR